MDIMLLVVCVMICSLVHQATPAPIEGSEIFSQLRSQVQFLIEARQRDRQEITDLRQYVQRTMIHAPPASLTRAVHSRQASPGYGVAFTACIGGADLVNLGPDQTIIFERMITNEGNAYHTTTGIFTAPASGVYVFHLSAMTVAGKSIYLNIVRDGTMIDDMLTDGTGDQSWESTSEMWALKLTKGSEVWIRAPGGGNVHGICHTMFTGFLLYEIEM